MMLRFGNRRQRSSRSAKLRLSTSWIVRLGELARNRRFQIRTTVCLVALVALLLVVESWRSPFPYRRGDRLPHGVLAAVDFQRTNRRKTERRQSELEEAVPFHFRHNSAALEELPRKLHSALLAVVQAQDLEDLSDDVLVGLNLDAVSANSLSFSELQQQLARDEDDVNRVSDLIADFSEFIAPLRQTGVIRSSTLSELGMDGEAIIVAISEEGSRLTSPQRAAEFRLADRLLDQGDLGDSWPAFPNLLPLRGLLESWLRSEVPTTLDYDEQSTESARRTARTSVPPIQDVFAVGSRLIEPGERIDDEQLALLQAEHEARDGRLGPHHRILRVVIVALLIVVLAALNGYYLAQNEPQFVGSLGRLTTYLTALIVAVFLGRLLSYDPWRAEVIPITATVMIFSIAYNQILAVLTALTLALILSLSTVMDFGQFVVLMSASAAAVAPLSRVSSRSTLIKVGFVSGGVYFLVSMGVEVICCPTWELLWTDWEVIIRSARGAGWCLVSGYLVAGSLPFIEQAFGVVTDISLLEMSDPSHPLLQELVRRAPGTYNHSMTVGTIGEVAADAIGANGLLVRVGAYFHDIGKMLKPHYFIENLAMGSDSRHQQLAPAMSTLIIIGHVKDGVDLAQQHNLPQPLIEFIEQHHGTTLIEYFYREATRQADGQPDQRSDVEEASFRYPGPKPQSREAGVMMLADAVESASRTLSDPAPRRIESLVHEITLARLLDGQLEESSLTLSEIRTIEDSLTKSLIGVYHGRIKYPAQRTA